MRKYGRSCDGKMELKKLHRDFSVCKVADYSRVDLEAAYCFIGKTDEERSLVCLTQDVPPNTMRREDGWKGLRFQGVLDFSLVGVLSDVATVLADNGIPIFAVSPYNTDYVFMKREHYQTALDVLARRGYSVVE